MSMKRNLMNFGLLVALMITISCQKEKKSTSELILGKWEWVSSISSNNVIPGQVSTPQTEGYSLTFEFFNDGLAKEFRNDQLVNTYNYGLSASSFNQILLNNNNKLYNTSCTLQNDNLIFDYSAADGPIMTYIRKK